MNNVVDMVCGYNHNPSDPKNSARRVPDGHYHIWPRGPLLGFTTKGLDWYSGQSGIRGWLEAFADGHVELPSFTMRFPFISIDTTYSDAYTRLAKMAGDRLVNEAAGDMAFAHSLGTRVVLLANKWRPGLHKRIALVGGAETVEQALPIIKANPDTQFLNVCAKADDIVRFMGGIFAPEDKRTLSEDCLANGIPEDLIPDNVTQVILDDPDTQELYREKYGWDLRGDNPDSIGDHGYYFLWEGNWPLYQAFFKGEL